MICGTIGDYHEHFSVVKEVFGYCDGVKTAGRRTPCCCQATILYRQYHVNDDHTPEQLAEIAAMAAETVRRFGIEPRWRCCRLQLWFI